LVFPDSLRRVVKPAAVITPARAMRQFNPAITWKLVSRDGDFITRNFLRAARFTISVK
jgi:hypothetical protein